MWPLAGWLASHGAAHDKCTAGIHGQKQIQNPCRYNHLSTLLFSQMRALPLLSFPSYPLPLHTDYTLPFFSLPHPQGAQSKQGLRTPKSLGCAQASGNQGYKSCLLHSPTLCCAHFLAQLSLGKCRFYFTTPCEIKAQCLYLCYCSACSATVFGSIRLDLY